MLEYSKSRRSLNINPNNFLSSVVDKRYTKCIKEMIHELLQIDSASRPSAVQLSNKFNLMFCSSLPSTPTEFSSTHSPSSIVLDSNSSGRVSCEH